MINLYLVNASAISFSDANAGELHNAHTIRIKASEFFIFIFSFSPPLITHSLHQIPLYCYREKAFSCLILLFLHNTQPLQLTIPATTRQPSSALLICLTAALLYALSGFLHKYIRRMIYSAPCSILCNIRFFVAYDMLI